VKRTILNLERLEKREVPAVVVTYADRLIIRMIDGQRIYSVNPYPDFPGDINVTVGDVNKDGFPEIVTAVASGGGPHVKVFDGATAQLRKEFYAYAPEFMGGVNVAVGNVVGDNHPEIITGAGKMGGPHVKVFDGVSGAVLNSFFAGDPRNVGGVKVAVEGDQLVTNLLPMFSSKPSLIGKKEFYLAFSGDVTLEQVQQIWERVARDYAPYDVNITTMPPTSTADRWGMVVIGGTGDPAFGWNMELIDPNVGGVALVGAAFNPNPFTIMPAFVFAEKIGWNRIEKVSEAVSHELGHLAGLLHSDDTRSIMFSNALATIGGFFLPLEDLLLKAFFNR